jgi:hypothetical protein
MENLFVKNSKFNLEKLKENKAFLLELVGQIKDAYHVGFYNEENSADKTIVEIGSYRDAYNNHTFEVNGKGVIAFESTAIEVPIEKAKALFKKYPKTYCQWNTETCWMRLKIEISSANINSVIKDVVFAFETKGQAPAFTLKR